MTAFTERDRAKRAKLKARYDSMKQKSARGDGGTNSPMPNSAEIRESRDDEQFKSAIVSVSDSASRDAAPSSSSEHDDVNDRIVDVPARTASNNSPTRTRANQLAIAKKKLAASRKATSPMKNAHYSYSPVLEKQHIAKTAPPIEEKDSEPYTPPRVVSKRSEMARKLAASRAVTSSPQPPTHKPERQSNSFYEKRGVNSSAYVKNNAFGNDTRVFAAAGSAQSRPYSLDRKNQQTGKTQTMDKVVTDKRATTRSNELARLRAASPAVVAAATAKPKMEYSTNDTTIFTCDSDGDESSMWDECLAKDAVLQRREQFRKKQEGLKEPVTVRDTSFRHPNDDSNQFVVQHHAASIRQQFLEKQEENRRAKQSFHQPSVEEKDDFHDVFQNNIASTEDIISDPPLTIASRSSSQEKSASETTVRNTSFRHPNNDSNQFVVQHHVASMRQQLLEKQEENRRSKQSFHQSSVEEKNDFDAAFQNNVASTEDAISDPPLTIASRSSSQEKSASETQTNRIVQPPAQRKEESEIVAQDFGEGFGFSQEEFSHASWGLGPAFSSEIIANDDADWSRPFSCSDKKVVSTRRIEDFSTGVSNEGDDVEDKENVHAMTDAVQGDFDVSPVATASVQYVDFGVGKSRGGSVDCDSTIDEREELNNSIVSEETTASATEFDPLSMFGGSDEASQQLDISDDNAQSKVPLVVSKEDSNASSSPEDGSNSISFPSLNTSALMKPPKPTQQLQACSSSKTPPPPPPAKNVVKPPPDSPSGTESLESWWQSRYASSQNNDINSAVQEALLNETSSASKKTHSGSFKNMSGVSTLSNSLTPVKSNEQEPSCEIDDDESCSIFSGISGIDEDVPKESNFHAGKTQNLVNGAVLNKELGEIEEEEEDIFSGVSVSQIKDLQADDIAMKSELGGNSSGFTLKRANAESTSMLYGPNAVAMSPYAKCKVMNSLADGISTASFSSPKLQNTNATSQYMRDSYEPLSSLSENNYGVIELKNNEKSSPANSHTSDITSSVIFGCDPPRRIAHQRYEGGHESILEANESEEAEESLISKEINTTVKSEQIAQDEVSKSIIANRAVSLVAPSTCDTTTQGSTFDQTKTTGINTDAESEASPYFGLSGLRDQAKAAILSRFSCGLLNTSSFACVPKGELFLVVFLDIVNICQS